PDCWSNRARMLAEIRLSTATGAITSTGGRICFRPIACNTRGSSPRFFGIARCKLQCLSFGNPGFTLCRVPEAAVAALGPAADRKPHRQVMKAGRALLGQQDLG